MTFMAAELCFFCYTVERLLRIGCWPPCHYTNYTQLHIEMDPTPFNFASCMSGCLEERRAWVSDNLNQIEAKPKTFWSVPHTKANPPLSTEYQFLVITFPYIPLSQTLELDLTQIPHIPPTSPSLSLKKILKLCPSLSQADTEKLIHVFISRLDYCNALLVRILGRKMQKL